MKLRAWLTLTTAAAGLVVFTGAWAGFRYYRDYTRREIIVQSTLAYMASTGRAECETSAATWMPEPARTAHGSDAVNGRRPPMRRQLFAYDAKLVSANPDAPGIDESLKTANAAGEVGQRRWIGDPVMRPPWERSDGAAPGDRPSGAARDPGAPDDMRLGEVLVPMPWHTGPCANILVRFEEPPESAGPGGFSPPTVVWVIPVLFMILTVLAAAGPVVGRIRRLTRLVRESAGDRYRKPIALTGRDEIGELAAAFESAREEILAQVARQEEREQNLRTFLENTTHDISIPLTVLQGHLSDLAKNAGKDGTDAETVGAAITEAQYLAALIGNLAIASKIDTGQPAIQLEPLDMNGVVMRCVARHRPLARQLGVSLDHAIPEGVTIVQGDMTFIEQALNNVIFNAIRHNRREGHVAVILEAGPGVAGDESRKATLSIIDDGPGIPDEELSLLAERYYRAGKERGRGPDSQGIGLNIASRVAAMHGWEFSLARSDFGGLKVCFTFAVATTSQGRVTSAL